MGNNMTVDWKNQLEHQFTNIEVATVHHTLGVIDVYQYIPDNNVKIFSKKVMVYDKNYFLQKTKLKHRNLLRALALEKLSGPCHSDQESYEIYFDYPGMITLEQIVKEKMNQFTEESIWDIIFQMVDCAEYLQQHYRSISNINPKTIYVLNDGIKILDVDHLLGIPSSYSIAMSNTPAILSPEQIDSLNSSIQLPSINFFKSDVYAFGITLLCLINKVPYKIFYPTPYSIDKNAIFQRLSFVKTNYSELLHGLIQKMLTENPEQRQSWIDIKQFIQPFKILQDNGQPFYTDLRLCPQINPNAIPTVKLEQTQIVTPPTSQYQTVVQTVQPAVITTPQQPIQIQQRIPQVYQSQAKVMQSSIIQPSQILPTFYEPQKPQEIAQPSQRIPPQSLSVQPGKLLSEQPTQHIASKLHSEQPSQNLQIQSNNPNGSTFQTFYVQPTLKQM